MKKKIINGFLMVALLAATVTSFVSCKDNDEDVKTDLIAELNKQAIDLTNEYMRADSTLRKAILANVIKPNNKKAAYDSSKIDKNKYDWDNLTDEGKALLLWALNSDNPLMQKDAFTDSLKAHYGIYFEKDSLEKYFLKKEDFNSMLVSDNDYQNLVKAVFGDTADGTPSLGKQISDINERIDNLPTYDDTELRNKISGIEGEISSAKTRLDALEELTAKMKDALEKLITSVTVNATSTTLLSNSKIFPGLNVQFVGAAFGQAVTSEGTFPSSKVADLNGNKLNADYINITEGEAYEWSNNIINNEKYNAGKVYFTVNPSNIDENHLKNNVVLSLTNSQNNRDNDGTPIVTLDNVKKSNKVLTWGTTRGESQVTLFEADATYDMEKANAIDPTKMIDFNSIKNNFVNIINAAKSITRENDQFKETTSAAAKTTIQETAKAVATLLNAKIPHLPALALKAEWNDAMFGTRNVISDYSLAATAYKPLSFNFGKEVGDGLPTISLNKIDNAVFKFAKKFKNTIDEFKTKVSDTNLNFSFDLKGLDPSKFNVEKTIYVFVRTGEKEITVKQYDKEKDQTTTETHKVTTIEKIYFSTKQEDLSGKIPIDDPNKPVENFEANTVYYTTVSVGEDLTSEVKKIKDAVNKGVDTKDIENLLADAVKALDNVNKSIDNVTDLVDLTTNYLESIVNGAINFVNKGGIARALEPVLLANTQKGIVRATGSYEAGEYTFVPTTMTYEIVAPAFKKYIAIVDKTGKARFGKVLTKGDDDFSAVKLTLQQDDVKLIYAAMDFTGRQIIKEYDITVK